MPEFRMPAKPAQEPERTPATTTPETAAAEPDKTTTAKTATDEVPAGRLPAGVYEFTGALPTQYLEVPLTARPADDDRPATVFEWPFSAPDDGRWQPSKRKPNQMPDNFPAHPEGE